MRGFCAFCRERFRDDLPEEATIAAAREHMLQCEKHPLHAALTENNRLKKAYLELLKVADRYVPIRDFPQGTDEMRELSERWI